MKPFTSKHCTQYLTKSSPLNQGYITKAMRDKSPEEQRAANRRIIERNEKIMGKPEPTVIKKASKKLANKEIFKKGSELDEATLKRIGSKEYKKESPLDIRRSMEAKAVAAKQKANKERARKAGNLGRKTTRCASGKPCQGEGRT